MLSELNCYSWDEIRAMDLENVWYVLPISALEQHGPHLPLGTDDMVLHAALRQVLNDERVAANMLLLPAVHMGNSHEHLAFAGTVSLSCSTIVSIVRDILHSMKCTGVSKLIFVNGHGGNTQLLDAYAQEWEQEFRVRIFNISLWCTAFYADAAALIETPMAQEVHAGEIETSLLQYARHEVVRTDKIGKGLDCPGNLSPFYSGWRSDVLSPDNGTIGVPSRANAATGQRLFHYTVEKIVKSLIEIPTLS